MSLSENYDPSRYIDASRGGPGKENRWAVQREDGTDFGRMPFLDWQTSFSYGSCYPESKGRVAWVNSIRDPVLPGGSTHTQGPDEMKRWAEEVWGNSRLLLRGNSKAVRRAPGERERFGLKYEEWRQNKEQEEEARRICEEERVAAVREKEDQLRKMSASQVNAWKRQKARQARAAARENKLAKRLARKQKKEDEKRKQEYLARYEAQLKERALERQERARRAREAAVEAELRASQLEEERKTAKENAYKVWLERKATQEKQDQERQRKRLAAEAERARQVREAKWAKKAVVLAYSGVV
mmetsp:Transcript_9648/g.15832  ORF Transcript_9648/g.15832 Transcript_9648/m.15832 type:complete len:299 (+) Transcript_9648:43-939(+)